VKDLRRLSAASTTVAPSEASSTVGSAPVSPSGLNSDNDYSPKKSIQRTTVLPPTPQPVVPIELLQPIATPQIASDTLASTKPSAHMPIVRQNSDAPPSGTKTSRVFACVVDTANTLSRKAKRQAAKPRKEARA